MKHILIQIKGLVLLMLLSFSFSTSAATLPGYYPEEFARTGMIDHIDIKNGKIVINDMTWKFLMNVKVHSLNTEFSSVQTLRNGMKVGFTMSSMNGTNQVAEIWVLPGNHKQNRDNRE